MTDLTQLAWHELLDRVSRELGISDEALEAKIAEYDLGNSKGELEIISRLEAAYEADELKEETEQTANQNYYQRVMLENRQKEGSIYFVK